MSTSLSIAILATAAPTMDPAAAARIAIDNLGADALAKAASYTRGSELISVLGLLVSFLSAWLIVRSRILGKLWTGLSKRSPFLRSFVVAAAYLVASALITLPWSLYTDWWRESSYGRTSQPLGDHLTQGAISLLISALLGGLFFSGIYALLRRMGSRWWIWSGALASLSAIIFLVLSPVLIEPLFNDYKPVPAGPVRDALEKIATDTGIAKDRIFVYNGSRQSNNFTANVSGFGPYARIAISDVALTTASLDEVRAVTGHEAGHYVLQHVRSMVLLIAAVAFLGFFLVDRLFPTIARLLGCQEELSSPAGLPVLLLLFSVLGFLIQPAINTLSRAHESEADQFSLKTVNLPDALAGALIKTAEYRNPRPHPAEEFCFYSHPSVERRVQAAMEWKENHER